LNSKLVDCAKALLPLREVAHELLSKIGNRRVCLARYGQKAALSESMRSLLEELSKKFELHVAIAVEVHLQSYFLSGSTQGQKLDNCFPFLFSPLAANLELKKAESSARIPGSYRLLVLFRLTVYNTIQHTKRLCDYKISLSSERPLSVVENSAESIGRVLSFIENTLIPSVNRNKLRFEVYLSLRAKNFLQIQEELKSLVRGSKVVKIPAPYVLAVIKALCGLAKVSLETFADFTFTSLKVLCEVYYHLIVGVFCTNRLTEDLLLSKARTILKKTDFTLPVVKLTTDALLQVDWKCFSYKIRTLFKNDITTISMLLAIAELANSKVSLGVAEKLVSDCASHLGPLFLEFYKDAPRNERMVGLSLHQFIEKQAVVRGCYERDVCMSLLVQAAKGPGYFEGLTKLVQQTAMFCKQNGVFFSYIPESTICDSQYLFSLTCRYSLDECENAVENFFVSGEGEKFFQLEVCLQVWPWTYAALQTT
jgi:hypothetical protein